MLVTQLCPTLCHCMGYTLPGSSLYSYLVTGGQKGMYKLGLSFRTCPINQDRFFSLAFLCFDYFCIRKKFQEIEIRDRPKGVYRFIPYLMQYPLDSYHLHCFWSSGRKWYISPGPDSTFEWNIDE